MSDVMESDLTEEQVRADVRTWLKANWDPELSLLESAPRPSRSA